MDEATAERAKKTFDEGRAVAPPQFRTVTHKAMTINLEAEVPNEAVWLNLWRATCEGDIPQWLEDNEYPVKRAIRCAWHDGFMAGWLAANDARILLGDLLDGLTPYQQHVIRLVYDGHNLDEIADLLGLKTRDGVQWHLRQAAAAKEMTMRALRQAIVARRRTRSMRRDA